MQHLEVPVPVMIMAVPVTAKRVGDASSEHSNQDEKSNFDQESGGHDRDRKKHVTSRDRGHSAPPVFRVP
jgi:hypothetical protein